MIAGIGIDIVEVGRLQAALEGTKAMEARVFTEEEVSFCRARKNRYQHLSGRFAAKEAALKALGTGWSQGIKWKDVEILSDEAGKPFLRFHGKALEFFEKSGARQMFVSITHSAKHAVAVVVLEA